MALKLRLPTQYMPALTEFVGLSPDERMLLLRLLQDERPSLSLDELSERVSGAAGMDADRIRRLVELMVNFNAAREFLGLSVQEFVEQLHAAMEASGKGDLKPADWTAFEDAVATSLAENSSLAMTSKAVALLHEHAKGYFSSRVLTDLRPVFFSDVEDTPAALIAVHTLKLTYDNNSEVQEFYLALDRNDAMELIEVLQRALRKEESLQRLATEKGLTFLEVKP